ncbi:hypothetical protein [Ammoniphilus sp. 3BR4]
MASIFFVTAGISKVPISKVITGAVPFILLSLIILLLVTYIQRVKVIK